MRNKIWKLVVCLSLVVTLTGCKQSMGTEQEKDGLIEQTKDEKKETNGSNTENNVEKADEEESYMSSKLNALKEVNYSFQDVSVHDPSVIEVDGTYYVFGSHLAGAKSEDLMGTDGYLMGTRCYSVVGW